MKPAAFLTTTIMCCALGADAQDITDQPRARLQNADAANPAQSYSQAEDISRNLPLDLLALNSPGALEGLAVLDANNRQIGTVAQLARHGANQSLYVVVSLATGGRAALPLDALTLAALAYYDPAQSLSDQVYQPAEFERISQYQAGHSARGSLRNPPGEPAAPVPDDPDAQPAAPAEAAQQAQADATQLQAAGGGAQIAYIASGSPIVQLALTHPDALQRKQLLDEAGKPLGEISHVAKNIANQALYAVIDMNGEHAQTTVKLDALRVAKLGYAGEVGNLRGFDEEDFVPLAGQ